MNFGRVTETASVVRGRPAVATTAGSETRAELERHQSSSGGVTHAGVPWLS